VRWTIAFALVLACAAAAAAEERIVLRPDERAGWSPANLFAFVRPGHFWGERTLAIETAPAGAALDLFYVRASFQKRYEQATAPVTVVLPRRIEATKRDSVTIRAFLEGYRIETVHVPVRSSQERVVIDLAPLPNALAGAAHTYFGGRAALALLLKEAPTVRVQSGSDGFSLILAETAGPAEAAAVLGGIRSPLVARVESQQLGEDLLVRVHLAEGVIPGDVELRSRQHHDDVRDLHRFTVDLVPRDRGASAVERARATLAQIDGSDVSGCAAVYDQALRDALDPAALSRALAPRGEFTDLYLRAALRRLGEVSRDGVIHLAGGERFRPDIPLELAAAASQAAKAEGYLALLRRWVALLEPEAFQAQTLRSLVAPELDAKRFEAALAAAAEAERRCRGGGARVDAEPRSGTREPG
jgi:hypothetical protein